MFLLSGNRRMTAGIVITREGFGNIGPIICEALGSFVAGQPKAAVPASAVCATRNSGQPLPQLVRVQSCDGRFILIGGAEVDRTK